MKTKLFFLILFLCIHVFCIKAQSFINGTLSTAFTYTSSLLLYNVASPISCNVYTSTTDDYSDSVVLPNRVYIQDDINLVIPTTQTTSISCTNAIYFFGTSFLNVYDPSLPISATNPSATTIPAPTGGGLALLPNLNGGSTSPTFYTVIGTYYYWWDATMNIWTNTGHQTNSDGITYVNMGGCGSKIYNMDAALGNIYSYDGTGTGTFLCSLTPNWSLGGGPWDIATDCNCNFYVLDLGFQPLLYKYTSNGVLTNTYTVTGGGFSGGGGFGFALVGNTFYALTGFTNNLYRGIISGNTINFNLVPGGLNFANGSSLNDFANCNSPSPITATASANGLIGCGTTAVIVSATTAVTPVTYSWSGPGLISTPTASSSTVNQPGTYSCTIIGIGSCASQTVVAVTVLTTNILSPTITVSGNITCTSPNVQLSALPNLATNNYTWTGQGILSGQGTPTIIVNAAGVYTLTTSDASNNCSATITATVISNFSPINLTVTPTGTISCTSNTIQLIVSPSISTSTITWGGSGIVSGQGTPTIIVNADGLYSVQVINFPSVCSSSATYSISNNSTSLSIVVLPANSVTICALSATNQFTLNGSSSYTWSPTTNVVPLNTNEFAVNPNVSTNYTVIGTTGICTGSTIVSVIIEPNPNISLVSLPNPICAGQSSTITAFGGISFTWNPGGTNTDKIVVSPITNTTYSVIGATLASCSGSTSITLSVAPVATISIIPTPIIIINLEESVSITAQSPTNNYTWYPETNLSCITCSNPIASPTLTTIYCVKTIDGACTNTACTTVEVKSKCNGVNVLSFPNAFSPNNDGKNDEFCLQGNFQCITDFYISIFNRWGEKVFETSNHLFCWDGTDKGKILDPAVFIFYVKIFLSDNTVFEKKGNISLIK